MLGGSANQHGVADNSAVQLRSDDRSVRIGQILGEPIR
jgi:hypothetical protein